MGDRADDACRLPLDSVQMPSGTSPASCKDAWDLQYQLSSSAWGQVGRPSPSSVLPPAPHSAGLPCPPEHAATLDDGSFDSVDAWYQTGAAAVARTGDNGARLVQLPRQQSRPTPCVRGRAAGAAEAEPCESSRSQASDASDQAPFGGFGCHQGSKRKREDVEQTNGTADDVVVKHIKQSLNAYLQGLSAGECLRELKFTLDTYRAQTSTGC
jgi:hypothetical protein